MSWRAIIHMLFEQYGFHQIANFQAISGDPDPMLLIYRFFSLWGPIKKKIYKLVALDQGRLILLGSLQFDEIHIAQTAYE